MLWVGQRGWMVWWGRGLGCHSGWQVLRLRVVYPGERHPMGCMDGATGGCWMGRRVCGTGNAGGRCLWEGKGRRGVQGLWQIACRRIAAHCCVWFVGLVGRMPRQWGELWRCRAVMAMV